MPMTATFTLSATAPSATVLPHTSAISSCGSATISTEPTRAALTTTGTSRLAIGAAIRAANHAGARSCRVASEGPTGGRGARGEPAASFTTIRTWRTSRNCELRSARNFSAGTACCMSATASRTSSSASSIDAATSTRVDARAWRMVTAPATNPAITSITTKTMRSCARTERPCHSACDRARADGHASGCSNGIRLSDRALMYVLPVAADQQGGLWERAWGNGSLIAIPAPQRAWGADADTFTRSAQLDRVRCSEVAGIILPGGVGMEARKAYFMVRAQVPSESDRAKFDQWYGMHHLPLAMNKFHAEKGWRFWSRSDSSVHYALYQFKDMATLRDRLDSPDFKLLIADFDQAWPGVTRSRDLIEAVQEA